MGKYFSDIHASCESQFCGLPHGLADTPEIAACRAEPENYEGLLSLADALCWQLRFREAIDALTRAIALAPERVEAYRKRDPNISTPSSLALRSTITRAVSVPTV